MDLEALRAALLEERESAWIRWVPGPQQLADALTKVEAANTLLDTVMAQSRWSLRELEVCREQRAEARGRRRRTKDQVTGEAPATAAATHSGVGVESVKT